MMGINLIICGGMKVKVKYIKKHILVGSTCIIRGVKHFENYVRDFFIFSNFVSDFSEGKLLHECQK